MTGDIDLILKRTVLVRKRLKGVKVTGPCKVWTGCTTDRGYGQVRVEGKVHYVHRWLYEKLVGPIPKGLTIDHLCRRKLCCNVRHMEVVTRSVNSQRAAAANASDTFRCGHSKTDAYVSNGRRTCRSCKRERNRRDHHRRKARAA